MLLCLQRKSLAINAEEQKDIGGQSKQDPLMKLQPTLSDALNAEIPGEGLINFIIH